MSDSNGSALEPTEGGIQFAAQIGPKEQRLTNLIAATTSKER